MSGVAIPKARFRKFAFPLAILAGVISSNDAQAGGTSLTTGAPDGFEEFDSDRQQLIDVFFEGEQVGTFMATVGRDGLHFDNPAEVLAALPPFEDPARVLAFMAQSPLPTNRHLLCPRNVRNDSCGVLSPEIVGIIYSGADFRLDLFVNPALLSADEEELAYLPPPDGSFSLISHFSGYASNTAEGDDSLLFAENRSTLMMADWRVRTAASALTGDGFDVDLALVEREFSNKRIVAGLQRENGSLLSPGGEVIGIGIETQNDTLLDKDNAFATPLVVYLRERGRVEVLLDQRLLVAKALPAGSHAIDTTGFPEGSYTVTLRISEGGRPARSEDRHFSRNRDIPLLGRPAFSLLAGVAQTGVFGSERWAAFGKADLGLRLSDPVSVFFRGELIEDTLTAQSGVAIIAASHRLEATIAGASDGSRAANLRVASNGIGAFNYGAELRYFDLARHSDTGLGETTDGTRPYWLRDAVQISGTMSYTAGPIRLLGLGNFRSQVGSDEYEITARANWDVMRRQRIMLTGIAEVTETSRGNAVYAGLTLSVFGHRGGVNAAIGHRSERDFGRSHRGFEGSLWANASAPLADDVNLDAAAGYERTGARNTLQGTLDLETQALAVNANAATLWGGGASGTHWSVGGRSTLLVNRETIRLSDAGTTDSAFRLSVHGARADDVFDVLVDGQPRVRLHGDEARLLTLLPYERYSLELKPVNSRPLRIDRSKRRITLVPGGVVSVEWSATPRTSVFARLIDAMGVPIAGAQIIGEGDISEASTDGFFQIESAGNDELDVRARDGTRWIVSLPPIDVNEDYVELGDLIARGANDG